MIAASADAASPASEPTPTMDQAPDAVLISVSPSMRNALDKARLVAHRNTTVLITGETGTGKNVLARYIHRHSNRSHLPFFELNCAAISRDLVESELFGHEKGAFTGAISKQKGLIKAAHGSTLLLDEIGDMTPAVQAKLLHVLDQRLVRPVGSTISFTVDVRFLTATNRDLVHDGANGRFREDLYHRLSAFVIHLPPLRARTEEIAPLATHFLCTLGNGSGFRSIHADALEMLCAYAWPGNVRELHNVLEHASVVFADAEELLPEHLTALTERTSRLDAPPPETASRRSGQTLRELERTQISDALRASDGNIKMAARQLGISRATLYRRLSREK